jgi:hypothetical protein
MSQVSFNFFPIANHIDALVGPGAVSLKAVRPLDCDGLIISNKDYGYL